MNVLMITPRVDEEHDILGFIVRWVNKLAEKLQKLYVISMNQGKADLRENVEIYSLDKKSNKLTKIVYFNRLMFSLLPKVDVVFCHMYPEFTIMVAPFAKLFRVPIVTWYAHGHVGQRLKIAHFLANKIVTSSKEGFRIKSNKVIIIGQGIDTEGFRPPVNRSNKSKKIILSVGRISPVKDYETLIKAANILVNEKGMKDLRFIIVGGVPMTSQEEYYAKLKKIVRESALEDYVKFVGKVPYTKVVEYYQNCDIFVSTSHTGSLDKTVLEAMACEKPVLTCNEAFLNIFNDEIKNKCYFKKSDHLELSDKLKYFLENDAMTLRSQLREIVVKCHSINSLTDKLVRVLR